MARGNICFLRSLFPCPFFHAALSRSLHHLFLAPLPPCSVHPFNNSHHTLDSPTYFSFQPSHLPPPMSMPTPHSMFNGHHQPPSAAAALPYSMHQGERRRTHKQQQSQRRQQQRRSRRSNGITANGGVNNASSSSSAARSRRYSLALPTAPSSPESTYAYERAGRAAEWAGMDGARVNSRLSRGGYDGEGEDDEDQDGGEFEEMERVFSNSSFLRG